MSCSGGEASLVADTALAHDVVFPPLDSAQREGLRAALGPKVALANPLDYHTYIWNDAQAMADTFTAMLAGDAALGLLIVDFPRADRCDPGDWDCAIEAAAAARRRAGKPLALVATLPDALPEPVAERIIENGLIPMLGLDDALTACAAAARLGAAPENPVPILRPGRPKNQRIMSEADAKAVLAAHGLAVPPSARATTPEAAAQAAAGLGFPVVLKGMGAAHKTESGLVALNLLDATTVAETARSMPSQDFLVEGMIAGGLAELLVGIQRDPAHGFVLTLAAGGTLTEVMEDSASLLLPVTGDEVAAALDRLRIAPLLRGFRGKPAANIAAITGAVMAVQDYVTAHAQTLEEVEINPLICTPDGAIAADALIRIGGET